MRVTIGLETPFELSSANVVRQENLKRAVAFINTDWAKHAESVERIKSAGDESWSPETDTQAALIRSQRIGLLNRELKLRDDAAAFLLAVREDAANVADRARVTRDSAEADLRAKLVAIGFVDGPIDDGFETPGISSEMIARHPAYFGPAQEAKRLSGWDNLDTREQNKRATAACRQALAGFKADSLAGLS